MRALSNLIVVNSPDLVLFVGEALVGNDAVDQLTKFNQRLADLAQDAATAHTIDGILLTKFDTIDDKVRVPRSIPWSVLYPYRQQPAGIGCISVVCRMMSTELAMVILWSCCLRVLTESCLHLLMRQLVTVAAATVIARVKSLRMSLLINVELCAGWCCAVHGIHVRSAHHVCRVWPDLCGPQAPQYQASCQQPAQVMRLLLPRECTVGDTCVSHNLFILGRGTRERAFCCCKLRFVLFKLLSRWCYVQLCKGDYWYDISARIEVLTCQPEQMCQDSKILSIRHCICEACLQLEASWQ